MENKKDISRQDILDCVINNEENLTINKEQLLKLLASGRDTIDFYIISRLIDYYCSALNWSLWDKKKTGDFYVKSFQSLLLLLLIQYRSICNTNGKFQIEDVENYLINIIEELSKRGDPEYSNLPKINFKQFRYESFQFGFNPSRIESVLCSAREIPEKLFDDSSVIYYYGIFGKTPLMFSYIKKLLLRDKIIRMRKKSMKDFLNMIENLTSSMLYCGASAKDMENILFESKNFTATLQDAKESI